MRQHTRFMLVALGEWTAPSWNFERHFNAQDPTMTLLPFDHDNLGLPAMIRGDFGEAFALASPYVAGWQPGSDAPGSYCPSEHGPLLPLSW